MMNYKNRITATEFLAVAETITDNYFDESGKYTPHFGILDAYRLFYNLCVTKGEKITTIEELEKVIENNNLIEAFNDCIAHNEGGLTFSAAYHAAKDMVEQRKTSITSAVTMITELITDVSNRIKDVMSGENLSRIETIAQDIKDGKLSADAVVEAYARKLETDLEKETTPDISIVGSDDAEQTNK